MRQARKRAACCRSIYVTILSVVTLGCICALFAGTLILFAQYSIFQYAAHAASILVACLILSVVLLLFAIYVSVHEGNPCQEWTLAVLFFLFDVVILSFAIFGLAAPHRVVRLVSELWDPPIGQKNLPIVVSLEDAFGCCGWEHIRVNCTRSATVCESVIGEGLRKYCRVIAGCFLVFGVLLAVGVFLTVTEAADDNYQEVASDQRSMGTAGGSIHDDP
jgi:hypothetical protein